MSIQLGACAGWHGNRYEGKGKEYPTYSFREPSAPGWQALHKFKDVQVAWGNRQLGAVIELRGECEGQGDAPLDQYLDHIRIGWTKWNVESETAGRLMGRESLNAVVVAELDGVVRKNEFVIVKKDGCLFDLRYSSDPQTFEQGRAAFHEVVASFAYPAEGR